MKYTPRLSRTSRRFSRPVLAALLAVASPLHAAGFFLPNQSTDATARGNAWVATADSPAAVHYNPAGLVQLDERAVEAGLYTINLGSDASIGGTSYEAVDRWQTVPNFYYAHPVNDKVVLGLGVNSPFGLGTEWGADNPFRNVTTRAKLIYMRTSGVVSYKVNECFSIGAGLTVDYADATFEQGIGLVDGDLLRFEGDGFGWSWIVSALWSPHEQHSFGVVYRSEADPNLDGSVQSNIAFPTGSADMSIHIPATAAIGYAFRPNSKWTIEANVEWINWDGLDTLILNQPVGPTPFPFEWESSFIYELGVTYQINDKYAVSVGYDYNENSQPDTFFNPAVADADRHWFNAGLHCKGDRFDWSVGYQYGASSRTVSGAVGPFAAANGKYEADHHALLASIRYAF